MTFIQLKMAYNWHPIPGCPGRFVLKNANKQLAFQELLGYNPVIHQFQVEKAQDPVVVILLDDGALISYQKPDGSYVHTLNTQEGLARKLKMLGIVLDV
jgi:hypothetical protein